MLSLTLGIPYTLLMIQELFSNLTVFQTECLLCAKSFFILVIAVNSSDKDSIPWEIVFPSERLKQTQTK